MTEPVDLILEFAGEKIGIAIPPEPDLTPYEKTVDVDRKFADALGTAAPLPFGDASPGTATKVAREDHIHPAPETVDGNAGTATKLATARAIGLAGAATGTPTPFDGSRDITIIVTSLDAAKLTGTASVDTTGNAASATQWAAARTLTLSGAVSGSASFDGSGNISLATTSNIVGLQLGSIAGQPAGTAAAGTTTTAARSDHVHPLQTSVSGNAGTATKLATARTITLTGDCSGSASFDGSQNISMTTTVVNGGVQLGSTAPKAAGTAAAGTAATAARSDHVHPLQTSVSGNAGTATKLASTRTISLSGAVSGSGTFDGSENLGITTTSNIVGLQLGTTAGAASGTAAAGTASTAARSDHVHPLQTTVTGNAGTATKLAATRTITIAGSVSGSASFDGSANITITTTGGVQLGSTTPKVAGTAAVGTATTAARSDHVHPLQTTVSGNAGTATKLATSRTITLSGAVSGSGAFDGSGNLSITTTSNIVGLQLGTTTPKAAGTAAAGTATTAAKSDHVHPLQTTITGNAGTATTLATARTLALAGTVTGSASFDGSANVSITTRVNNTAGSEIKFWTGTDTTLPASRSADTIYFVTE